MNTLTLKATSQRRILAVVLAIVVALSLGLAMSTTDSHAASTDPYLVIADNTYYTTALNSANGYSATVSVAPANSSFIASGFSSTADATDTTWTSNNAYIAVGSPSGENVDVTQSGTTRNVIGASATVSLTTTGAITTDPIVATVSVTNDNAPSPAASEVDITIVVEPLSLDGPATGVRVIISATTANGSPEDVYVDNTSTVAFAPTDPFADGSTQALAGAVQSNYVGQKYPTPLTALTSIIAPWSSTGYGSIISNLGFGYDTPHDQTNYSYLAGISAYISDESNDTEWINENTSTYDGWQYRVYDENEALIPSSANVGISWTELKDDYTVYLQYGAYNISFPTTPPAIGA